MTRRIGKDLVLEKTPDGICEFCWRQDELRPYGPKGEFICFGCAMKDEASAQRAFAQWLTPH